MKLFKQSLGYNKAVQQAFSNKNNINNFCKRNFSIIHPDPLTAAMPTFARIVEVGPRDGLQNEKTYVPADTKIDFINRLSETGLRTIEATSFVSPKMIPQMKDSEQVFTSIDRQPNIMYPALVFNLKGLETAIRVGAKELAIGLAASQTFSRRNTNASIEDNMKRSEDILREAQKNHIIVRGYISTTLACPYEGATKPDDVAKLARFLLDKGCYEVSLGDTIGVGTPAAVKRMLSAVLKAVPASNVAVHFHNTYGMALANVYTSLQLGISIVDSSTAGLGGCPYAAGASGNVATEDVVYMMHGLGIETGVDLDKVIEAGDFMCQFLQRRNQSSVASAVLAKRKKESGEAQKC